MSSSLWMGLFVWDALLASLTLACYWWSAHFALKARQGQHAHAHRLATVTLHVCAGGCVGLLVVFTLVVTTEAR